MKFGLIIYSSLNEKSGGFLYDRKLVEYLRSQGDEVDVISLPWRNYPLHMLDNFSMDLIDKLSSRSYHVLLQDELNHPSLFLLNRLLKRQVHHPFVSIVHHLRSSEYHRKLLSSLYGSVERLYLSSVDGFIFNSETTRSVVKKLYKGYDRPDVVARPGGNRFAAVIPEDEILNRAYSSARLNIIFLGNVIPRKGLHVLLDSLARLPQDAWNLQVIGSFHIDENYAWSVRKRIHKRGWVNNVSFLGYLEEDLLEKNLRCGHVMVIPSTYEGFGIAYLEGMNFGLPAIGSSLGGACEIITHDQDGFLVTPGDSESIGTHLLELYGNRERLVTMSLAARSRFLRHPSWDDNMSKVRSFLIDLV